MGDQSAFLTLTQFTENSSICTEDDITYSIVIIPEADFISFVSKTRIFSWSTSDFKKVSNYNIKVTGTIKAASIWT